MKTGTITLEATVTASDGHDLERYLEQLRHMFANSFSAAVHDYYPDARIRCEVVVGPKK